MKLYIKQLGWILIALGSGLLGASFLLDAVQDIPVGSTITTINATDLISDSRSTINTNLSNLNTDKLETTTFYATTTHSQISSLSSLAVVGTITTGTWNATAIAANKGGTGFTTYSTGDLIYASAANTLAKRAASTTNEVLTLRDGVPTWSSRLTVSANQQSPLTLNSLSYIFPPAHNASSTILANNGSGSLSWVNQDWQLLGATTTVIANATSTVENLSSRKHLRIVFQTTETSGSTEMYLNFNHDQHEPKNYRFRWFENMVADTTSASSTQIQLLNMTALTDAGSILITIDVSNPSAGNNAVKMVTWTATVLTTSEGAPYHFIGSGAWYLTTSEISSVQISNESGTTFPIGSLLSVYGSRE